MTSAFMLLDLPVPTITLGPLWASQVNAAFNTVDSHDHSSGKGVKVKPNGLDISADLDIQINNLLNVQSLKLSPVALTLTGPTNTLKVYSYNGDLWYTNSAGAAVQITAGGALVAPPGNAQVFETRLTSTDLIIDPSDSFVEIRVDTTAPRNITLPLAASVAAGRIFKVKDISGLAQTNNITIIAAGSDVIDGDPTLVIDFSRGSYELVGNGVETWDIT